MGIGRLALERFVATRKVFCFSVIVSAVVLVGGQLAGVRDGCCGGRAVIDLAGRWDFRIDPDGVGQVQRWFEQGSFNESINLPGSMAENGFGNDITAKTKWTVGFGKPWLTDEKYAKYNQSGDIKIPFWLQPGSDFTRIW